MRMMMMMVVVVMVMMMMMQRRCCLVLVTSCRMEADIDYNSTGVRSDVGGRGANCNWRNVNFGPF